MILRSTGLHLVGLVGIEVPSKHLGIFIEASEQELQFLAAILDERLGRKISIYIPENSGRD